MTTGRRLSRRHGRYRLLALLAAGTLVVAACAEGDDDDDAASTDTTAAPAEDEGGAEAALGEPNPAAGDPVKIGLISSAEADSPLANNWQRVEAGVNMATEYANEYRGGIGGRPIEMVICQGGVDPAGWQDCANQLVNDDVSAVIQPFNSFGSAVVPIVTGAGIPYVVLSAAAIEELTSPGAFSQVGGFPTTLAAIALHAQQHDYTKFGLIGIDVPAVSQAAEFLGAPVFEAAGVGLEFIPAPVGVADMSPQMQAAIDGGSDSLGLIGDQTFCASFLQAYQTLGLDVPLYLVATCIDPTMIETYGEAMAGNWLIGFAESDPADPDVVLYGAIADTYGDGVDPNPSKDTGASTGATVLLTLLNQLEGTTDVTPAGILASIQAGVDVPLFLGGGSLLTCDGTAVPLFANICSAYMLVGTATATGEMEDAELLDTAPLFAA
jgi:branched-chain amino acid transport system substrate-binding protein